jgi:hypothetical protein
MFWMTTKYPTLEITTNIAPKGCVVDCAFCPQRTLEKSYTSEIRTLTLDTFKFVLDKVPSQVRVTFSGFTEPWLNRACTDMLLWAYYKGHPVAAFTTGVGMMPEDVERFKHVDFAGFPNGGFTLHLPDAERIAKHPITKNYLEVLEAFKKSRVTNFYTMCMSKNIHPDITHIFNSAVVPMFWNRAGNLTNEVQQKPDYSLVRNKIHSTPFSTESRTCGCVEKLYHNVLLPNGDVSLCCMDYSLKYILGNLLTQKYDEVIPKPDTPFLLCQSCENGVKV